MKRILQVVLTIGLSTFISSCNSDPAASYGYEAKMAGQDRYINSLASDNYITQSDSWHEKLDSRKQQFNDILKRQYLEFARNLTADKDYTDATYFRRKGLNAERANFNVMPENPSKWNVKNEEELEDLRSSRLNLIDALVGYTPVIDPNAAAKAIVYYDCWVQSSQSKKSKYNESCKKNLKTNYERIAGISKDIRDKDIVTINKKYKWVNIENRRPGDSKKPKLIEILQAPIAAITGSSKKTQVTKINQPDANSVDNKKSLTYVPGKKVTQTTTTTTTSTKPVQSGTVGPQQGNKIEDKSLIADQSDKTPDLVYVAYFDKNSELLSDIAKTELDKAVAQIKKNNPKSISVNGHTDRSFAASASLVVSKKRADAVRDYLVSKGVSKDIIRTYGFGKTDNLVENNEGEEKSANNRSEIIFKGSAN